MAASTASMEGDAKVSPETAAVKRPARGGRSKRTKMEDDSYFFLWVSKVFDFFQGFWFTDPIIYLFAFPSNISRKKAVFLKTSKKVLYKEPW